MRNHVPIFDATPSEPRCSLLKKKYASVDRTPTRTTISDQLGIPVVPSTGATLPETWVRIRGPSIAGTAAPAPEDADLERVGDQAVNIAESVLVLIPQPPLKPLIDIPRMATIAEKMIRDALDAFVKRDAELARDVLRRDDEVDELKDQVFREAHRVLRDNGILIVNARPETNWFQNMLDECDYVCFLKSRVKFIDMNGKQNS